MKYEITKVDVRPTTSKSVNDRVYIFINKETIGDGLVNRRNRPYLEYKKLVLPLVMEQLPRGYDYVKDEKWEWDQYVGCSCGCSPGFIGSGKNKLEIFVDVTVTN